MAETRPGKPNEGMFSRFTQCSVCLEKIKDPRSLPCQHSFCHKCLLPLVSGRTLACPTCRETCKLKPGGVEKLPRNPMLVEALEKLCDNCQERRIEKKCQLCEKPQCTTCQEICKLQTDLKEMVSIRSSQIEDIKKQRIEQMTCKDNCLAELHQKAQRAIDAILAVQTQLAENSEEKLRKHTTPLDEVNARLSDEIKKIESLIDTSDRDRVTSTEFSVQQMGDDLKQSMATAHHMMPSDMAKYSPDVDITQIISDTVVQTLKQPVFKATNYKSASIKHETFGTRGSGEGQFNCPMNIALSPVTENLIVVDMGNYRIQIFDKQHQYLREFGSSGNKPGQFMFQFVRSLIHKSSGVGVTSRGHIVVSDTCNNRLQMFTEQGELVRIVGSEGKGPGEFNGPRGLAIHCDQIYVCDHYNDRIQILAEDGTFVRDFSTLDTSPDWCPQWMMEDFFDEYPEYLEPELKPSDVAVWHNGDVVVVLNGKRCSYDPCGNEYGKLMIFTNSGHHKLTIIADDHRRLEMYLPYGLTLSREGHIIVTASELYIFTQTGQLLHTIASSGHDDDPDAAFGCPFGVLCTKDGRIIFADTSKDSIHTIKFN